MHQKQSRAPHCSLARVWTALAPTSFHVVSYPSVVSSHPTTASNTVGCELTTDGYETSFMGLYALSLNQPMCNAAQVKETLTYYILGDFSSWERVSALPKALM